MPLVRDHTLSKWDLELFSKKGRGRLSGEVSSPPAPSADTRAQTCPPGQNKSPPANECSSPQKHSRLPLGGGGRKGQREKGSGEKQKERGGRDRETKVWDLISILPTTRNILRRTGGKYYFLRLVRLLGVLMAPYRLP